MNFADERNFLVCQNNWRDLARGCATWMLYERQKTSGFAAVGSNPGSATTLIAKLLRKIKVTPCWFKSARNHAAMTFGQGRDRNPEAWGARTL